MASQPFSQFAAGEFRDQESHLPEISNPLQNHSVDDEFESIIRSLTGLRLDSPPHQTAVSTSAEASAWAPQGASAAEWAELLVREMESASDSANSKARASTLLEGFENSVRLSCLGPKKQAEENEILKKAVVIQFRRNKELEEELRRAKQAASQCQEQLRAFQLNNYALAVHLKRAHQTNGSISGRFPPDVF